MKEVTDPSILEQLNGGGMQAVTDPAILAQLEGQPSNTQKPRHWSDELVRQFGLAARYGLEGAGETLDFVASPVRAGLNAVGVPATTGALRSVADSMSLPKPEGRLEGVVGTASRMLAGTGGMVGGARAAASTLQPGVSQNALRAFSARPDMQAASSIGAGAAGGYARESGAGQGGEFAASLAGGLAAPFSLSGAQRLTTLATGAVDRMRGFPELRSKIDDAINRATGAQAVDISPEIREKLYGDMQQAMQTDRGMTPDAIRRLLDYRMTGLTPTAGGVTLDPGVVTRQKNLMKLGANSQDPKLQSLSQIENQNAARLTHGLNELGAGTNDDALTAGQKIIEAINNKNAAAKSNIDSLYSQARGAEGRSAQLDPSAFTQNANNLLDEALLGGKLPADVRNHINNIAIGKTPFTVDVAEQLKTRIGDLQRATNDRAESMALGLVRGALDETPLMQGQEIGKQAIGAFNLGRAANRDWMKTVESTPALKAVRDGIEPDKFVKDYIVGTGNLASVNSVMKIRNLVKDSPEAMSAIKNNIAQTLKKAALSGADDEVGRFSQSGYNRAISSIGDLKLKLFFDPKEVSALKAIGRVASYEQFQPTGSAVNNSNTASTAIATVLDRIGGLGMLRRVPGGAELLGDPLRNVARSMEASRLTKIPANAEPLTREKIMLLPPALSAYLLSVQEP